MTQDDLAEKVEFVAKAMFPSIWAWEPSGIVDKSDNEAAKYQARERARLAIEAIEAIARADRTGP